MTHLPAGSPSPSRLTSSQAQIPQNSNTVLRTIRQFIAGSAGSFISAAVLLLFSAFSASAPAQTLVSGWNQLSPANSPPERYIHAMTYDAGHGQVVLFGGFGQIGPNFFLNDTWLWNGSNWTQATPANSPDVRGAHALVYDAAHGQVVMFGGTNFSTNRFGDTWLWDGTNWTQVSPTPSPSARDAAVLVYDATHHNVVLFGGSGGSGSLADTWIWDGTNWTNVTPLDPASSPSPRADYSMVYDAAHSQVVLFGGSDSSGFRNDTWTWNGTTWTQLSPGTSPPARDTQGMAYDPALGGVIMWGGEGVGGFLNDTWAWDGTNWTQLNSPTTPPAGRYAPNAVVYDSAQNQLLLFSGQNTAQAFDDTWTFGPPQNFGNINVCPGTSTLAPCSNTLPLTYNFSTTTTLSGIQIVTQGAPNLDFTLAGGNTCTGTISAGGSCTLSVTFTPTAPGLRTGAVNLYDSGNNLIATSAIYGNGQAPAITFEPGTSTTLGGGFSAPSAVAVDAKGNVYVADPNNAAVYEMPSGCNSSACVTSLGGNFSGPSGIAVDGAGKVYVANENNHTISVMPSGCTSSACTTTLNVAFAQPNGLAVDSTGNLFVIALQTSQLSEIPVGCNAQSCVVTLGGGFSGPQGVAVDASGNIYVADSGNQAVKKVPAGCTSSSCVTTLSTGFAGANGLAVDAAGDVYVSNPNLNAVYQIPAGCASSSCVISAVNGLVGPTGVALDGTGNVYVSVSSPASVQEVNRTVPSVNLGVVSQNFQSSDTGLFIQNVGNQTLTGSLGAISGAGFFLDQPQSNCGGSISLASGASCTEEFYAQTSAVGPISGTALLTDNSFNGNPATQQVSLSALSQGPPVAVSVTGSGAGSGTVQSNPTAINCSLIAGVPSGTCSTTYSTGLQISFQEVPTGGSTFAGWGGACASAGTNQICVITVNSTTTVSANFAPPVIPTDNIAVTLLGSGVGTVTDNSTGINCTLTNGALTGACNFNYPVNSQVTLTAVPAVGTAFAGWGAPCSGTSLTCTFTVTAPLNINAMFAQQSFGNVNVCPPGQGSPAPCSQNLAINFDMAATTTLGAIQVVTQGAAGLDFTLANGSTCTGAITAGNTCTVNVTFTPRAPGLRMGAVTLYDNSGNSVATFPIYGIGQAPLAVFDPGTQNTLPVSGLVGVSGVAVDAAGNVFISENAGAVKITPAGVQTTVPTTGISLAYDVAVDGAGNIFLADLGGNKVVKVTPGGVQTTVPATGLSSPSGVAVDGAGNLFITDLNNNRVVKVTPSGVQTTVPASGVNHPYYPAVDAAGDVFFLNSGTGQVLKVTPGGVQSTIPISGLAAGNGVAVDAAGDVFVSDQINNVVLEVSPSGVQSTVPTQGLNIPAGLAVDASGNLFIAVNGQTRVVEVNRSQLPSLTFVLTNVGSTSTDSPQIVTLQNVGNQPLNGASTFNLGGNFSVLSTCGPTFSLLPGSSCSENFGFSPQSTGYFTGTASFSDNTLNLSPLVVFQPVTMTGIGGLNGQATTTAVPNVVGLAQSAAGTSLTGAGLVTGSVSTASSSIVPSGSVIASNPAAGTQVALNSSVKLLVSSGPGQAPTPNPLSLMNNYFVTGDYAVGGVTLRGAPVVNNRVSGSINIPAASVPTGADLIDGFLYWATLETSPSPSAGSATFLGYSVSGQQIGSDLPYTDPVTAQPGTLRLYRANINTYFQDGANGVRVGSGAFTISLPSTGTNGVVLTEGASLVVIYRVLSPSVPLKAIVIYDGSAFPTSSITQNIQGFYDAAGGGNGSGDVTSVYLDSNGWNNPRNVSVALGQPNQYNAPLNAGAAYGAVILSTLVNNPDNDGILGAWKAGPPAADFHGGEPGYYDVKTGAWVGLPGAKAGQKDLFVQLDYMCGALLSDGSCDPSKENFFPSPDSQGNDPLAMVRQAFANSGITLHLQVGNAIAEDTCTDSPGQPCQFPGVTGVIGWKNSLEFSKVWPRNLSSCAAGGDCSPRFAYGQKDSYHYVLFGHSLAIPAWNSRYQTLTSINAVAGGQTTITTTDRGTGKNACPSRITISGIQGMPALNGVFDTNPSCPDTSTIIIPTPAAVTTNWSYPNNTLPEPVIGITSGTVTSISGYSDLGGADSAVTLGLWETAVNQDMSKKATVVAGTLFHELGHTIGLGHGGIYYDGGNFVPTFEANCKPNYQSIMNYLFQLDGVGPASAIAFSNQALTTLTQSSLGSVNQLVDTGVPGAAATFATSSWYISTPPSSTASAATLHCDGTPLTGDTGYRVTGSIAPITPAWSNGQNVTFDGQPYTTLRGFNDISHIDLRQVGATGGQFASLASVLAFGSATTPLNIAPGGSVSVSPGGTVTLGAGGSISVPGGNVTVPTGGTISGGGTITFGTGGNVTLGGGGTITPGTSGVIGLPSGGNVTLGGGGTITLGGGGTVTLGGGGTVTLGGGGTITLGGGGSITIPAGGSYTVPAGGTITLGAGGTVTLGGGGNVTLGGGGTITLGGGGTITLGGGGNVTLGGGGTITLGGGGNVTLGGGGNITLGGGGTITLGGGGNVTLGGGGNVTLGGGGTVTLGGGGAISIGSGGNVTLGAGGTVTLGGGGNITLGGGGNVTLGGGGNITLGGGGTITLGGGGTITMDAAGTVTLGAGGGLINGTQEPAGSYFVGAGGTITLGGGGNVTLGAGGNVTLGGGGTVTLGAGGNITLGGGGTVTLGGGGNVTLGGGGVVTLGGGGNITLGGGGNITLGGGGNVTLGGGGVTSSELDYDSANSIVRPPPAATYTIGSSSVRVDWTAPAFGVVATYTISRSVNGGTPVVIGSVSGVNGFPPATTFTDTNPPTSGTVVYTISTTLVPDQGTTTQRQSPPSPPAVLTLDQTIALDPLPSSVSISTSTLGVSATALSNNSKNNQLVTFTTTGPCSAGNSALNTTTGKSSATITLNGTGSCTVTASQPGDSTAVPLVPPAYSAATPVSGTFTIEPANSTLQSQTITFPQLPNVQYGSNPVPVSATTTSSLPITFSVSGPCNNTSNNNLINITGAGRCNVTANAPGNTTYTMGSASQSFNIAPAVLTVAAGNLTIPFGQPIPTLTTDYTITGYVNGESSSVLNNTAPALSTTATSSSAPGAYPITVSTGSLAAANYDFLYVAATLTIQQTTVTISISNIPATPVYGGSFTPSYSYSGTGTPTESTTSSTPSICTVSGSSVSFVGVGTCTLTAHATATANSPAATGNPQSFSVGQAPLTITANNATKILNAALPSFTAGYVGFVNGDGPSSLSGTLSCTTTATATSPVGSYPINCSGQSSSNYSITYKSGTLKIIYQPSGVCDGDLCHSILQPINADGTSVWKQGRTVPAKFRVADTNGVSIGTPGVVAAFSLTQIISGTITNVDETVSSTTSDTAFRWDSTAQEWVFNISTSNLQAGHTYVYTITLNDGSTIMFQFGLK